jgi:hypothetical protein
LIKFVVELNKGVFPFLLNEVVDPYILKYPNVCSISPEDEIWDDYYFFDYAVEVYVNKESQKIESIACRENCYLNGINLIDLPIEEFIRQFKIVDGSFKVEKISLLKEDQDVYDFDLMGLQLWVNSNKEIVTVFVS